MKIQFYELLILWIIHSMKMLAMKILFYVNDSMKLPFYENTMGRIYKGEVTSGYEFSREVSDSAKM